MRYLLQTLSIIILFCSSIGLNAQSDRYLHFDGVDDFAELSNASQYFTGAAGISMTGWFCSDGQGYGQGYFGFRGPGSGDGQMYIIELNNGTLECRYISSGGFSEYVSPLNTVQPLVWQHVAWVYNGSVTSLYINGVLQGSTASSGNFNSTNRSFGIGKSIENGFNFVFGGRIDEVSVWRKGLSQAEVQDIMANELAGNEADLELYYKMNQGVPGGNNTGITQLTSEVGAGTRDANLTNFTMTGATSNFNISTLDPSFTVSDYCVGDLNAAVVSGLPGGTFTFNTPPGDGATLDPASGSITGGVGGSSYDIRYTTLGDCAPHEIHTVNVLALDDPSFILSDYCIGSANSPLILGTAGGTFSFDPPPGDGAIIEPTSGSISDGIPGTTYTVLYETNGACSTSSTETVTVGNGPEIINVLEECGPDNLSYTVSFEIIEGDPDSYSVIQPGTLTGNTFVSDPIDSGTAYTFTVPETNGCGSAQIEGDVACGCPVAATLSGDISICEGTSGEITIELTGDGPWTIVYEIDDIPQPLIESATDTYTLLVTTGGSYQFYSATDNNCTSSLADSDPILVEVFPAPTATISGDEVICEGESINLIVNLTGEGPWDMTYAIDGTNEPMLTVANSPYQIAATAAGIYTIETLSDSQCDGIVSGEASLIVNELPTASIGGDQYFCTGENATIVVDLTGSPDYNLIYSIDGGADIPLSISNASSFDLITNQEGTFDLESISDANCTGTVSGSLVITEQPLPTALFTTSTYTICDGTTQELGIDLTGTADWTVIYTVDGVAQAPLNSSTSPFLFDASEDGVYEILTLVDEYCENSGGPEQVTIDYHPPISIIYSEEVSMCEGETAAVWAEASGGLGNDYIYTWEAEDLITSFGNTAVYASQQTGNVTVTINEACNYNQSFNLPITVNLLPPINISGDLTRCGPGLIDLINSTPSSFVGDDCTWIIDGEVSIENCGSLSQYFELGTHSVGLSMTSPAGCYNELFLENVIQVNPQSEAGFIMNPDEVTTTDSEVWFTNLSGEANQYTWTFGNGEQSFEMNPVFDFGSDQAIYTVCLITNNEFACSDSTCQSVRVENDLLVFVPNSFTPDDDGVNDYFFPVMNGVDENDYRFSIFDRHGNLLFETYDVDDRWNGSYKDKLDYYAADAWYTWKLVVKELGASDKQELTGTVLMVR